MAVACTIGRVAGPMTVIGCLRHRQDFSPGPYLALLLKARSDQKVMSTISRNTFETLEAHLEGHQRLDALRRSQQVYRNNRPPEVK